MIKIGENANLEALEIESRYITTACRFFQEVPDLLRIIKIIITFSRNFFSQFYRN